MNKTSLDGQRTAHTPPLESQTGNRFQLLENGEEYFPAVFAAIGSAQHEVIVETFILFEDAVGRQLQQALIDAASRGVRVELTVDGYGSPDLSESFIDAMTTAGVQLHVYDPRPRLLGVRINLFRRMHRKIVAIDGFIAFIGGINYGVDHLLTSGSEAKQDYAVRVIGPLAGKIHRFAQQQAAAFYRRRSWWPTWRTGRRVAASDVDTKALLVVRDNAGHRDDIEREYRAGIRSARREIIIAIAYFFPGYRLLRQIQLAAQRGVSVKLILQGAPDMPQAKVWATMLYPALLKSGVEIYEYCERPLHAKVAVIDDEWSTIGSSNLDPLSLALNLEANIVVYDRAFNAQMRARLEPMLCRHCQKIDTANARTRNIGLQLGSVVAFHLTRHFPKWAGWLPAHHPMLHSISPPDQQAVSLTRMGVAGDDSRT